MQSELRPEKRIEFLDFMRGFAVVVMVLGHSIDSTLGIELRRSEIFRLYDAVRGFTAPIFLFLSGFAFTVATEKRWTEFHTVGRRVAKRLQRIAFLLIAGYALHFPFFSFTKLVNSATAAEYAQFFQVDVLHCVAISLLVLQALVLLSSNPRVWASVVLGLAACIVLTAPLIWSINFAPAVSSVLSPYFNQQQPSIFPMFPYAAFLFAGAGIGHFYLEARRASKERSFFGRLLVAGIVAGISGLVFDLLSWNIYPPHDYWKVSPNFFLVRFSVVILITAAFFFVRRIPALIGSQLVVLGKASLFVYGLHLLVVYGSAANDGLMQIVGQTLPYYLAAGIGILVLFAMLGLVHAWNYLRADHHHLARYAQAAFASTLLLYFFTKPW